MCRAQCVLAVVALSIGVAHCWDLAVGRGDQLMFYNNDRTQTNTIYIENRNIGSLAYDEVRNIMVYVDKQSNNDAICTYNLSSKENKCFRDKSGRKIHSIAYDPATEKLFFTDTNENSINSISCENGCNGYIQCLLKNDNWTPTDIAVDSCRGYIFWFENNLYQKTIAKARLDGSVRENVRIDFVQYDSCFSLTVDPKEKKFYFFGDLFNKMWGVDYNNALIIEFVYYSLVRAKDLTLSKGYFYWTSSSWNYNSVWVFKKNTWLATEIRFDSNKPLSIAANYKLNDLTTGTYDCESLSRLVAAKRACANYCLQGTCRVNDYGLPKCSCNPGYTGYKCEVSVCHGYCQNDGTCSLNRYNNPVCQCKAGYVGDRCEITDCLNYCIQGKCSLSDEGHPTCSCNAGYSGEKCEVSACHGYCQNDGTCSLNENSKPVCQCKAGNVGDKCEITIDCLNYCIQGNCSFNDKGHRTCSCNAGYSGERCEVSACHGYCQNDGTCSLNEHSKPVCQCKADYSGDSCEISDCLNYCIQGNCSLSDEGHPTCSCNVGYTGERCEVSACHGYCLNDGECSLDEEDEPVCQCVRNYDGLRCEVDISSQ